MSSRQLILIVVIAAVLGAVGWLLLDRSASSWESRPTTERQKILSFPLNDVTHITIKDSAAALNLAKNNGEWVVRERADYPANFEQVSRLLRKIWELKPVQQVKAGPSQFARLNLTQPGTGANCGTLVELKGNDEKRIAALLIGKTYFRKSQQNFDQGPGFPAGRYVMPEDGSNRVSLISDPLPDVTSKADRWLNRDFIKIEKPRTIALVTSIPEKNWKVVRDNNSSPWKFLDTKPGEEADPTKAAGLASSLAYINFADVLESTAQTDVTGLDKPSVLTIETFDGFAYSLRIGKLNGQNYPINVSVSANLVHERPAAANEKPEDKKKLDEEFQGKVKTLEEKLTKEKKFETRTYLVAKSTIEQLLKNRSDLVKAPSKPTSSVTPSSQSHPPAKSSTPGQGKRPTKPLGPSNETKP
jgi:hypothetical protein